MRFAQQCSQPSLIGLHPVIGFQVLSHQRSFFCKIYSLMVKLRMFTIMPRAVMGQGSFCPYTPYRRYVPKQPERNGANFYHKTLALSCHAWPCLDLPGLATPGPASPRQASPRQAPFILCLPSVNLCIQPGLICLKIADAHLREIRNTPNFLDAAHWYFKVNAECL